MIELKSVRTKNRKRKGHGISAGQGKTAGRGTKGQKSRAGHNIPKRFEGGQTVLSMRLPILPGFKSHKKKATVLSLDVISKNFKNGDVVTLASLIEKKLVVKSDKLVKILNTGKLTTKVSLAPEIKTSKSVEKFFAAPVVVEKKKTAEKPAPKEKPTSKTPAKKSSKK